MIISGAPFQCIWANHSFRITAREGASLFPSETVP
jgi:hypothetical protein